MKYMEGMEVIEFNVMDMVILKMEVYDYEKYIVYDVFIVFKKDVLGIEDFVVLLLFVVFFLFEEMVKRVKFEICKYFGNLVYMFILFYIVNYCENYCIYCGFNCYNKIKRVRFNVEEIEKEM